LTISLTLTYRQGLEDEGTHRQTIDDDYIEVVIYKPGDSVLYSVDSGGSGFERATIEQVSFTNFYSIKSEQEI
jgi:hypothetical protein